MSEHIPKRSSPNLTLAVLLLGGAAYAVLSSAVIPALTTMQHDLHTTETGVAWLLTGYLLAASVGTSIIGRLGDMYGKERLLLWTLLALAGGTLLSAVSHSLVLVVIGRVIQGAGGGIYPLAFGIIRDEFPREKVAGGIGIMSAILGVGGGAGIVLSGPIIQHLSWHWLFWIPLVLILVAAFCTWRFVPESPVRAPGRINWLAAGLMSIGITASLLAISQTTEWGWGSAKTLGLLAIGIAICVGWVIAEVRSKEPLIDMTMMRIRGVWTTNLAAFLLGGGMYTAFLIYPEFAQLAKPAGYGVSNVTAGLYLLPMAVTMAVLGTIAGRIAARVGSKVALVAGSASTMVAFALLAITHAHPYDMLISSTLTGVGIGLAFAALGNLIVEAVSPEQTGVATGMNTVTRTLGGALGGQISATFIAAHVVHGTPQTTGFSQSFVMCTAFLVVALLASLIVPGRRGIAAAHAETAIAAASERGAQLTEEPAQA